jgi:hypothetical protein
VKLSSYKKLKAFLEFLELQNMILLDKKGTKITRIFKNTSELKEFEVYEDVEKAGQGGDGVPNVAVSAAKGERSIKEDINETYEYYDLITYKYNEYYDSLPI